jgi:hypothetical protein
MNLSTIIDHYIKLRDTKSDMEERHKDELAPIKEQMELVEAALQKHMQDLGLQNLKAGNGTAYLAETTSAKVMDWETTLNWITANQRWDMLERRVNKTAVMEEEDGVPGVQVTRIVKTHVRRS